MCHFAIFQNILGFHIVRHPIQHHMKNKYLEQHMTLFHCKQDLWHSLEYQNKLPNDNVNHSIQNCKLNKRQELHMFLYQSRL